MPITVHQWEGWRESIAPVPGTGELCPTAFLPPTILLLQVGQCDDLEKLALESEKPGFNSGLHYVTPSLILIVSSSFYALLGEKIESLKKRTTK